MTKLRIFRLASSAYFRRFLLVLIGIFAILTLAKPISAQQLQHVPGTSVSLEPMEGFLPSSSFNGPSFTGFANQKQGSIVVMEMPAEAYQQFSPLFGDIAAMKSRFAQKGIIIDRMEEIVTAGGSKTPLLIGSQKNGATTYDKWMAFFKGSQTVMVTVTSPQFNKLDISAVKAMMESVSIGSQATLAEQLATLRFTATAVPPFRIVNTLMGANLGMTVGDKDVDPTRTQPMLSISYEVSKLEDSAKVENFMPSQALGNPQVESREPINFAGNKGILLSGHCDGHRRFSVYMALTSDKRVIIMNFTALETDFDKLKPVAELIANSVTLKQNR